MNEWRETDQQAQQLARTTQAGGTAGALAMLADWVSLLKPRIAALVGLCAFVGAWLGAPGEARVATCLEAALWITLAAGAANAFNQVLERDTDRLMERTRNRPLAAGRLGVRDALLLGGALCLLAVGALAWRFNLLSALLALSTVFVYVAVYTPLKRVSTLNTLVGALPGAAPPLIGYAALSGTVGGWACVLFALVFAWQFPHFMAIAWLYREDYARAGLHMLPAAPGREGLAGRAGLSHGLLLLPVIGVPILAGEAGLVFGIGALVPTLIYLAASARFALRQEQGSARVLLLVSLAHLPLVLLAALLDPLARAAGGGAP